MLLCRVSILPMRSSVAPSEYSVSGDVGQKVGDERQGRVWFISSVGKVVAGERPHMTEAAARSKRVSHALCLANERHLALSLALAGR